jgi:hypothetical protein
VRNWALIGENVRSEIPIIFGAVTVLGLIASAAMADLELPCTFGVRIVMTDGTVKSGYVAWVDDESAFGALMSRDAATKQAANAYPRQAEVPRGYGGMDCGQEGQKLFELWLDYSSWCASKGVGTVPLQFMGMITEEARPAMPPQFVFKTPVAVPDTFYVGVADAGNEAGQLEAIPFSSVQSVRADPTLDVSEAAYTIETMTAKQMHLLRNTQVLHVVEQTDIYQEHVTTYFFDASVGPIDWLNDCISVNAVLPLSTVTVDGMKIWTIENGNSGSDSQTGDNWKYRFAKVPGGSVYSHFQEIARGFIEARKRIPPNEWKSYCSGHFQVLSADRRNTMVPLTFDWYLD